MYEKAHEIKKEDKRFVAALKGIDIDEGQPNEGEEVIRRGTAKAMGMETEEYELREMQIEVIDEDEDELEQQKILALILMSQQKLQQHRLL